MIYIVGGCLAAALVVAAVMMNFKAVRHGAFTAEELETCAKYWPVPEEDE